MIALEPEPMMLEMIPRGELVPGTHLEDNSNITNSHLEASPVQEIHFKTHFSQAVEVAMDNRGALAGSWIPLICFSNSLGTTSAINFTTEIIFLIRKDPVTTDLVI